MIEAQLILQGKNDPPKLKFLKQPLLDLGENPKIIFCLVEGGMASGEPSILIVSQDGEGSVIMQTSFDKFLMAASGLAGMAETQWGWARPEGYATLMPPDAETRKDLLLALKKELEEFDAAAEA